MLYLIIALVLALLVEYVLYRIAFDERSTIFFTIMAVLCTVAALAINWAFVATFLQIATIPLWILILLFALERLACCIALYSAAGEDMLVWFYFIFNVPLVGWALYWSVKIR